MVSLIWIIHIKCLGGADTFKLLPLRLLPSTCIAAFSVHARPVSPAHGFGQPLRPSVVERGFAEQPVHTQRPVAVRIGFGGLYLALESFQDYQLPSSRSPCIPGRFQLSAVSHTCQYCHCNLDLNRGVWLPVDLRNALCEGNGTLGSMPELSAQSLRARVSVGCAGTSVESPHGKDLSCHRSRLPKGRRESPVLGLHSSVRWLQNMHKGQYAKYAK